MATPRNTQPDHPGDRLNEVARLYPWRGFNRKELQEMTAYPREVVSKFFSDPETETQYDRARPEEFCRWLRKQDRKVLPKEARNDSDS